LLLEEEELRIRYVALLSLCLAGVRILFGLKELELEVSSSDFSLCSLTGLRERKVSEKSRKERESERT
jgi:hypothetical protein